MAHCLPLFAALILGGFCLHVNAQCSSDYTKLSPTHTMCKTDIGTEVTVTEADKQAAVDEHNQLRSAVSPSAANMQKLVWDDNLAKTAAKWARQCTLDHDGDEERLQPEMPGAGIGQNIYWSSGVGKTLVDATKYWGEEITDFNFGVPTSAMVGHYTQEVWDDTGRVGCGIAECPTSGENKETYIVCNYATGGNVNSPSRTRFHPYTPGTSCSKCPAAKCSNNLCDCGGLVCYNGGEVDTATCSCKCTNFFSGANCEIKNCPAADLYPSWCAKYTMDQCKMIVSLPYEYCPYHCKICP